MADSTTSCAGVVSIWDEVRQLLRRRMLEAIELLLDEELTAGLGCGPYERSGERCGYRNGSERRRITTEVGLAELEAPRGRVWRPDGSTAEFRSRILPRYARRSRQVDEALMGAYLAGVNTRRIRRALEPLVGEAHLSRSAVSRVVGRLKKLFETWEARDLSQESYSILFLDALNLKVRLAGRVVSVPVLAVLGVSEGGQKHLVALRLAVRESATFLGRPGGGSQEAGPPGAIAAGQRRASRPGQGPGVLAWGQGSALYGPQAAQPVEALSPSRPLGAQAGLLPDRLRQGRPEGPGGLRCVPGQVVEAVPSGGSKPGARGASPADLLRVPEGDVEVP